MTTKQPKSRHPLYSTWKGMIYRCENPSMRQWRDYGGRGISVCDRWQTFENFASDMGHKPTGYMLDRLNNDGNYEPGNCRWATRSEQQRNQRVTRTITIDGITYKAIDLADLCGLKTDTVIERAKLGLSLSEILDTKKRVFTPGLALGGMANGARKKSKTHCENGHEFTEKNTKITKQGWRACRRCHADREAKRRNRNGTG